MTIITETERLILREIEQGDAPAMFELNSDPEVVRYTGDGPFDSPAEAESFVRAYVAKNSGTGFGRWIIQLKETGEVLGWCGLKKQENGEVDLGYRIYRRYWGKGYATEAAIASLEYGFKQKKLDKIIGVARVENIASIRVLEKCGMTFERNDKGCDGDCVVMAVYAGK